MLDKHIPTLTISGFSNDPYFIIKKAFEYFLVTNWGQSTTFSDHIHSLKKIIQESPNDLDTIKVNASNALRKILERYFQKATVEVNYTKYPVSTLKEKYGYKLEFYIKAYNDDNVYTSYESFNIYDNKINYENMIDYFLS